MTGTVIPRWSAGGSGIGEHRLNLPPGLGRLAGSLGVPPSRLVLAAHLRVVALLTGEDEVTVGYAGGLVTARVAGRSWRDLLRADLTTVDGRADTAVGCDGETLSVGVAGDELVLTHRLDRVDADHAARIGGYLVRALAAAAADPDAPAAADLLDPAERALQLHGLDGPRRELPDRRVADLVAEQARLRPLQTAAVQGDRAWTYAELDRAADAVAAALVAEGLRAEEVVATVTDRSLEWLAAILGTFRAGGAYLPVEPGFPAERVAMLLEQSRCRLALTEPGAAAALAGMPVRALDLTRLPDRRPPAVEVGPDALAYVYFTSGSTGRPKGAMCEHAGMLNHLLAKVEDLGLGPGDVVVQNAQQSFDISLWQLVAPLLVGGRTLVLDRETILDPGRFLDAVVAGGGTILQVVPSYLEILVRELEARPRGLGRLRYLSVTGEAVGKPLVTRWLAVQPGIPLVNAYGATEASDDTTHEIIAVPPPQDLVPVGRPIRNVTVTVLGPDDELLPLGSVGEITFSGVCVGRGYLNDADRTAEAFGADPLRPGLRLYRTGDYGRWLPTGSLEFRGRRDDQVKVHGIRIELGEVESRIVEHPAVRTGAAVVAPLPGGGKALVGYYVPAGPLPVDELHRHLAAGLPPAAVPARLEPLDALPLTGNGKVDRKALTARATAAATAGASTGAGPRTPTEQRIAEAWARALERPVGEIGRDDSFFDIGGSSLAALRMIVSLDGLVSLADLLRAPVLRELAEAADGADGGGP
ncbi:MAG: non-ribosomal peptide synthetase [Mycobacteriales bacterium]